MAVVEFDAEALKAAFPDLADAPDARLEAYFDLATLYVANTDDSPIPYDPDKGIRIRKTVLLFVTCHVATLAKWEEDGQSGPVASAAEGSVNVSFAAPAATGAASDWWNLTPCGRLAWEYLRKLTLGTIIAGGSPPHPWG